MPKKLFFSLSIIVILLTTTIASAEGGPIEPLNPAPSAETGEMVDETPKLWFVELTTPPTDDGSKPTVVDASQDSFRNEAQKANLQYAERLSYDTLWNGLSISINPSDLSKLQRIPGVKAVYPVEVISIPKIDEGAEPDLLTALAMTGADIAQSELGFTGAGIKVAVMDTGIDYDHMDLGGDGVPRSNSTVFPTARVIAGWDFVGDAFNADPISPTYNPNPVPDPYPDDCNGHGTHVAGIVGANGEVKGVAPNVLFGAYRVFGCEGSTTSDIMLAAMEQVLKDKMQVLNMSIGSAYQWPQYPTAQAASRLMKKGIIVVASAGNEGSTGLYATGAPALGKNVISVASVDNTHVALSLFTISPDDMPIGYEPAAASLLPPTSGSYPMARTGTATSVADACAPSPVGSLTGQVALIRRGGCTFYQKSYNAQNAGAVAVALYNNTAGRFSPTVDGSPAIVIPVVAISDEEGVTIDSRLASGPVTMTWTTELGSFPNATGGLISSFSSYGLSPDLSLKPDIAAPGGMIYSTYPLEKGSYATLSGTSMASPHVAGAVALFLEARPNMPHQYIRDVLQNSADPVPWWGDPGLGLLDNVHRQGAGLLDIDDAILSSVKILPGKLSLGESEAGPSTQWLTIFNLETTPMAFNLNNGSGKDGLITPSCFGSGSITINLSHEPALATGANTFTPGFYVADATVEFDTQSVTIPAGGAATVAVTITAPDGPDHGLYGGYLVFTAGNGQVYRVPYAGFIGDYQSIVAMAPTPYGLPWMAKLIGNSYLNQPDGATFTMTGGDIPYFLVHFDHQTRRMRVEVYDAITNESWKLAYNEEYLPRNSTSTGFFAFPWDGTTFKGKKVFTVPDGQYIVKIKVLKALGEVWNPDDWETWTSPLITIDRP